VAELAADMWGADRPVDIIGVHDAVTAVQQQMLQFAQSDSPMLIQGETGTGKELFARGVYLLSRRRKQPMMCVNCAQYQDTQLLASELFGHRRGSFTGAIADRPGVFEEADRGVVFLDEIAELSPAAQAMLLRTLSEGEIVRVGENRPRHVNVRVVAATARDLSAMVACGSFRADLYYRLRFLQLRIPPVRERGDDWRLLTHYFLDRLTGRVGDRRSFSDASLQLLERHRWPGNVRELAGVVDHGFFSATGDVIEPDAFASVLVEVARASDGETAPAAAPGPPPPAPVDVYRDLVVDRRGFWETVYQPFMTRELSRREVSALVERGLREAGGSYKDLLTLFGIPAADYLKFMDFLRHHRLKRSRRGRPGFPAHGPHAEYPAA
jgi:anaerobic nitric oxide reductase transcription regulator